MRDSHPGLSRRAFLAFAAGILNEVAPRYPQAADHLRAAAKEPAALDQAEPLIGWSSPEQGADRNAKLRPLLAAVRDRYGAGIAQIGRARP